MKHKKILSFFVSIILILFFGILAWFAFQHPNWLLYYAMFTALPGYFLLVVLLTPLGNIRLGEAAQRQSAWRWWGGIVKGHIALLVFTFVVFLGFFGGSPSFVKPVNFTAGIKVIQYYTTWQWGIYPWGIYGFWAAVIAYMAYVRNAPPYLYSVAATLWPKRLEPMAKTLIEATQFSATSLVIASITSGIILLFSYLIEKYFRISHFTLIPITMSFFSFFVLYFSLRSTRLGIRHRAHWLTLGHLVSFCIIALVGILVISAFANQWFATHYPELVAQSVCKRCGDYFGQASQATRFASLYWGWWIIWTPLAGSYIAALAKGRTLRELIVGIYLVPVLIWLLGKSAAMSSEIPSIHATQMMLLLILIGSPFIAWWMLAKMLNKVNQTDFLYSGFMPVSADLPRNRTGLLAGSKSVGIGRFSNRVIMLIFGTLFFQTTAGWYGLQIQVLSMGLLVINAVYVSFEFFVYRLMKRKA